MDPAACCLLNATALAQPCWLASYRPLLSYGPDFLDYFYRAPSYVDKLLKGAKPADLPIEQPTKFKFLINLKAAKDLGVKLPPSLLLTADETIE